MLTFSVAVHCNCCLFSGVAIHSGLQILFCAALLVLIVVVFAQVLPFSALSCFHSYVLLSLLRCCHSLLSVASIAMCCCLCSGVAILCSQSLLRVHIATNYSMLHVVTDKRNNSSWPLIDHELIGIHFCCVWHILLAHNCTYVDKQALYRRDYMKL